MTGESPTLYALSVRAIWAWLIIYGGKTFENRVWAETYPGLRLLMKLLEELNPLKIYIHAGKTVTRADYDEASRFVDWINGQRIALRKPGIVLPRMDQLKRGGLIGTVTVTGWSPVKVEDDHWSFTSGLMLDDQKPIPFTPCTGTLGLFQPHTTSTPLAHR